jgi:hypothetical protein
MVTSTDTSHPVITVSKMYSRITCFVGKPTEMYLL